MQDPVIQDVGLSPRVRGSLTVPGLAAGLRGSIPACAGEPRREADCRRRGRVYPRVCGGAGTDAGKTYDQAGLSPRVRGSRHRRWENLRPSGSIPACAGEPFLSRSR